MVLGWLLLHVCWWRIGFFLPFSLIWVESGLRLEWQDRVFYHLPRNTNNSHCRRLRRLGIPWPRMFKLNNTQTIPIIQFSITCPLKNIKEFYNNNTVYHQSHLSHCSQMSTSSHDIAATTASFHMMNAMMPHWHDVNNQNYCGYANTTSSDMSGFRNIYWSWIQSVEAKLIYRSVNKLLLLLLLLYNQKIYYIFVHFHFSQSATQSRGFLSACWIQEQ